MVCKRLFVLLTCAVATVDANCEAKAMYPDGREVERACQVFEPGMPVASTSGRIESCTA
jgi:hypothetical protein|tara:strand:+ start:803 stop:979 length:177 start_codon:yes stop_codon:yes gene_type:complete